MKNYIVITSIFEPTKAVKAYAQLPEWKLIVVGDKKSPVDWVQDNACYLPVQEQEKMSFSIIEKLPYHHYARKMIGYLNAIANQAEIILDTDDDNIPLSDYWNLQEIDRELTDLDVVCSEDGFVNIYAFFSPQKIWPRGYPLKKILSSFDLNTYKLNRQKVKIGIWQGLADGSPDVDAIYRLTNNEECIFRKRSPIALEAGVICPLNSQNTIFQKEFFPLLYLPAFVTFRYTDILRGIVAQPIVWAAGQNVAFAQSTVFQERNPHDYLKDFEDEIPVYLQVEAATKIAINVVRKTQTVTQNIEAVYLALNREGLVEDKEIDLLSAWLSDIAKFM